MTATSIQLGAMPSGQITFVDGVRRLSWLERRLIFWMAKQQQGGKGLDGSFVIGESNVREATGRSLPFTQIIELLEGLHRKSVGGAQGGGVWKWISGYDPDSTNQTVALWLDPRTNSHLLTLPSPFSKADSEVMERFERTYTRKVYEIYCRHRTEDSPFVIVKMPLAELRDELGLVNEYRPIGQLYHWALRPSADELSRLAALRFEFEPVKDGRNVVALILKFRPSDTTPAVNPQPALIPASETPSASAPAAGSKYWWVEILALATAAPFHMESSSVRKLLEDHDWPKDYWLYVLQEIKARVATVEKPAGYTYTCLTEKYEEWCRRNDRDGFEDTREWWHGLDPRQQAYVRDQLMDSLRSITANPLAPGVSPGRFECCALAQFKRSERLPSVDELSVPAAS